MVLARMLTPDDFGCIGMLAIFIVIANTFVDSGLGSAIIQKKEITDSDLSTVFIFNFILSILLYCILYFTAPYIAKFYHIPLLNSVLKVVGLVLIINSFAVVQTSILKKRMEFNKITYASIGAVLISVTIAIIMAYKDYGVWSLVAQQLVYALAYVLLIWILSNWKPLLIFSVNSFKELFKFGSFIFFSNLINNIGNNIQGLIIGRAFNAGIMGYYTQARKLEELASTSISSIIDQVTYPALAEKQEDYIGIVAILRKMIKFSAFFSFPLMIFLAVSSDIIIPLCYGPHWAQTIPYFSILCIAGMAICLQGINYNAVAAIGKSNSIFTWTIIKRVIGLLLLFIGVYWGIYGVLIASVLGSYIILICNAIQVQIYFKYTLWKQFIDILPILGVTLISGTVLWIIAPYFPSNYIIDLLIRIIVFISTYMYISSLLKIDSIKELSTIIKSILDRYIHKT